VLAGSAAPRRVAKHILIDSTIVRAHQHAAGAFKKTVAGPHRLWNALAARRCINETIGVSCVLTGGERHDMPGLDTVFEQLPPENTLKDAVMDKGYDSNRIGATLQDKGITPVIPPKSNRQELITYDKDK
jgi:hypothetical protein